MKRDEFFRTQFNKSVFSYIQGKLESTEIVRYYRIEMQRYLKSVAEVVVTLDSTNPRKILVNYPGIYTEQDAKAIRIDRMEGYAKNVKKVYPSYEDWRLSIEKEKLHTTIKFEQEGVAGITIHDERLPYMNITTYSEDVDEGTIPYEDLLALSVQVSVPNYQGNKYRKKSKLTKLVLKKH